MSKKEEKLRRSVLSRDGNHDRDPAGVNRLSKRTTQVLAMAGVLAMGANPVRVPRIDFDAERGRFSSGDFHPDQCSCARCAAWRKAERGR